MNDEYDYIVVGSGAGGGTVACRLAEKGFHVLLLEAGRDGRDVIETQVPALFATCGEDENLRWDFWVRHYEDDARQQTCSQYHPTPAEEDDAYYQADDSRRGIWYPRYSALGGCTTHHAMQTWAAHNSDWDHLADLTNDASWNAENMRQYWQRFEDCHFFRDGLLGRLLTPLRCSRNQHRGREPRRRSTDEGFHWLPIRQVIPSEAFTDLPLIRTVIRSLLAVINSENGSFFSRLNPANWTLSGFDPNAWKNLTQRQTGYALSPLSIHTKASGGETGPGSRACVRDFINHVQKHYPDNLHIRTGNLVSTLLFAANDRSRVTGVRCLIGNDLYRAHPRGGRGTEASGTHDFFARHEVILAAGVFNTPQLLMLSGIGPERELSKHGIDVKVDLPGVGSNLQDRYEVSVVSRLSSESELLEDATLTATENDPHFRRWRDTRDGVYASTGAPFGIIRRSSTARRTQGENADPDLFIFMLPSDFRGYEPGYSKTLLHDRKLISWLVLKAKTENNFGTVCLRSADPRDTPVIDFHSFDDVDQADGPWKNDLDAIVDGVKFVRRINEQCARTGHLEDEVWPGPEVSTDQDIADFVQREAWGHHASCSCPIGRDDDPMAVLDGDFRVRGITGLSVVDASVFPRIPGFFIVGAIYTMAEKAAEVIAARTAP